MRSSHFFFCYREKSTEDRQQHRRNTYLLNSILDNALPGQKIAQRSTSWTRDVKHERELSLADLFGGNAPVGALIGLLERIC